MRGISSVVFLAEAAMSLLDVGKTCGRLLVAAVFLISLTPSLTWACACGCGIFDVGTPSLFPVWTWEMGNGTCGETGNTFLLVS